MGVELIPFDDLSVFWICGLVSVTNFEKFSYIIIFKIFSLVLPPPNVGLYSLNIHATLSVNCPMVLEYFVFFIPFFSLSLFAFLF